MSKVNRREYLLPHISVKSIPEVVLLTLFIT